MNVFIKTAHANTTEPLWSVYINPNRLAKESIDRRQISPGAAAAAAKEFHQKGILNCVAVCVT